MDDKQTKKCKWRMHAVRKYKAFN